MSDILDDIVAAVMAQQLSHEVYERPLTADQMLSALRAHYSPEKITLLCGIMEMIGREKVQEVVDALDDGDWASLLIPAISRQLDDFLDVLYGQPS